MFKLLPHGRVTEYLTYKLKEVGIEVRLIDESYTSVTDSYDEGAGVTRTSKGNEVRRNGLRCLTPSETSPSGCPQLICVHAYK
ncbi:MAG: transposase [Deltaproteobacteria bacterium]|nr:transposase [Deltaproteobacteria bacterium]MBW2069183.1 transposase [Deltaproteobacteria bacterium]